MNPMNAPRPDLRNFPAFEGQVQNSQRSFEKDLKQVSQVGFFLWLFISLIGGGGVSTLITAISDPQLGTDQVLELAQIFWLTAPLSMGVTLVVTAYLCGWVENMSWQIQAILVGAVLAGTSFVANYLGIGAGIDPEIILRNPIGGPLHLPAHLLSAYLLAYGAPRFISSLLVGSFTAWATRKLLRT